MKQESIPEVPLTPEALDLLNQMRAGIGDRLREVNRLPVGVLLWGPGEQSTNPLATVRLGLRHMLKINGHAPLFSEELCDASSPHPIRLQQLVQAQEFDFIVSLPCTPGAIAEIHDFAGDRRVSSKIMVFLNSSYMDGYATQSLQASATAISYRIEWYPSDTETAIISEIVLREVQKIRVLKYLRAGR